MLRTTTSGRTGGYTGWAAPVAEPAGRPVAPLADSSLNTSRHSSGTHRSTHSCPECSGPVSDRARSCLRMAGRTAVVEAPGAPGAPGAAAAAAAAAAAVARAAGGRHGRRRRRRWWGGRRSEPAAWGWVAAWRALVVAAARWEPARRRSSPPVRAWAAIRVRGAAARVCVRFEPPAAAHAVASEPAELLAGKRVVERGARLPAALEGAGVLGRREHGEQGEQGKAGRPHLVVGHAVVGGRRRSQPVQRGRRVGGMRVVWGHRHGGRQQAAARAIRTQGMGGTPVDAGIHRARKESVCVRAQPVVQARRWRAFVCLWPRECVAQP